MNVFYDNYKWLPSKILKMMLSYEGRVGGDPSRFTAIRDLLKQPRTITFRSGRVNIVKPL